MAHEKAAPHVFGERTPLLAPVAVETYSVLTRLPGSQRVAAATAHSYLTETFILPPIPLSAAAYMQLLDEVRDAGIAGGAVYDAVVAAVAREAGVTLLSLDRRAARTYEAIGVAYELVPE